MLDGGGGGGSMYAVQIESLETFQQKLTSILQSLEQDNSVLTMNDGSSSFGDFPEAQAFSAAYEQTKQDLINSFNEVTQLVNTMINVVGTNANKYKQTEQDITAKFNAILQQYGDTPLPTGPTPGSTSGTTYYPQNSGTTYATQSGTTTNTGTTTTTTTTTGSGSNTGTGSSTDTNTGTSTNTSTTTNTSTNTSAGAA